MYFFSLLCPNSPLRALHYVTLPCPSALFALSSNNSPLTITFCAPTKVIACIKLSLERKISLSDGVAVWLNKYFREVADEDEDGCNTGTGTGTDTGTDTGTGTGTGTCLRPTLSAILKGFGSGGGGTSLTEKDFSALKRKEIKQAEGADTISMMLHHAFYLVLPYQPFCSHHFMWGRFMRFFQKAGLRA